MDGLLQGKAEGEEWVVVSGPYSEQKKTLVPPPRLQGIQVEVKYRKTYLCLPPS